MTDNTNTIHTDQENTNTGFFASMKNMASNLFTQGVETAKNASSTFTKNIGAAVENSVIEVKKNIAENAVGPLGSAVIDAMANEKPAVITGVKKMLSGEIPSEAEATEITDSLLTKIKKGLDFGINKGIEYFYEKVKPTVQNQVEDLFHSISKFIFNFVMSISEFISKIFSFFKDEKAEAQNTATSNIPHSQENVTPEVNKTSNFVHDILGLNQNRALIFSNTSGNTHATVLRENVASTAEPTVYPKASIN